MSNSQKRDEAQTFFDDWYSGLKYVPQNKGPARGTLAAALVILDRLQSDYTLDLSDHTAKGGAQIIGLGKASVKRILKRFGEERVYIHEGGRTNRGARAEIQALLDGLRSLELEKEPEEFRIELLQSLQHSLSQRVAEYFNLEKIRFVYRNSDTTWSVVKRILENAKDARKHGPVAEYLVGAKLSLRFPNEKVRNTSFSASDVQSDEPGDFLVGNTAFHVTVAPNNDHHEKCKRNVDDGLRAYLLVPEELLEKERRVADATAQNRISVESLESFIGQNIDELSSFDSRGLITGLKRFLEIYNERVDTVETDKSLMIEIPQNLV